MPLDRRGLLVETNQGESLSLDVLSRGTREAVFIGLRLALTSSFARRGATLPLVLDDVLVNFDSGRVRCAAEVLCDFARQGHQVIMFTCHEHITDIFEDAQAEVRVLPSRDGSERVRRRRPIAVELPPPTPSVVPDEPEPVRTHPTIDPNPLLQMAALESPQFDPVHPLPAKPKRERKKKSAQALPDSWPLADISALSEAWHKRYQSLHEPPCVPDLHLPDAWPVADLPTPPPMPVVELKLPDQWPLASEPPPKRQPAPKPPPRPVYIPETFEVLAYRTPAETWTIADIPPAPQSAVTFISPPEQTPPPPKHHAQRRRFTWESPEMYVEDQD
jgi:hypothetical protein